jgi:hypothetical protein
MRFSSCNVRGLYRSGSLTTTAIELGRYKLDLVGVHDVSWDKGGMVGAGDFNFFYGKGTQTHHLGTEFFVHHGIVSAVKREFISGIILDLHAANEEKSGDSKESFYEEVEQVFDHFSTYHMIILLGDFKAKVERERIFSNRKWGMRVYNRIVMIKVLE